MMKRMCIEGCGKSAGTHYNPKSHWCPECDKKRIAHLDKQFEEMAAQLKKGEME